MFDFPGHRPEKRAMTKKRSSSKSQKAIAVVLIVLSVMVAVAVALTLVFHMKRESVSGELVTAEVSRWSAVTPSPLEGEKQENKHLEKEDKDEVEDEEEDTEDEWDF